MRPVGTHLYGRRLYEVMLAWETLDLAGESAVSRDFAALWHDSDKVVYSTTRQSASSARTRIERRFDAAEVSRLKASADRDLLIGGPDLAGQALRAGLVDELHLFASPVAVGGGIRTLPAGLCLEFELLGERRFGNGVVCTSYATRPNPSHG
jgi:dihydrofolate reductase